MLFEIVTVNIMRMKLDSLGIYEILDVQMKRMDIFAVMDTLEFLKRSERMNRSTAMPASRSIPL
jgi:hypothetical protein